MKKLLALVAGLLLGWSATASVTNRFAFYASTLPSQDGDYNCSYFSTNNLDVAAMLVLTTNSSGGIVPPMTGQFWDFSQLKQTNEIIVRADIVNPADGTDSGDFPDATYAEQDSQVILGQTNLVGWTYYSMTDAGRVNYGLFEPGTDADGLVQYDPPIVDVPATVTNGQAWSLTTSWYTTVYSIFGPISFYYQFSDTSTVDAYGTLVLPSLGAVPALRVHEVDGFNASLDGYIPYQIVTNQFYYWLVPGLGMAVQITMYGNSSINPGTLQFTNSVQRMYFANYFTNSVFAPTTNSIMGNLHIQLHSGSVRLSWNPFTNNPASYQVQANSSLISTNWQSLGLTTGTNWTDNLGATQRFYRVVASP